MTCVATDPHILTRFDGDLGRFRELVLNMGEQVCSQVGLASQALSHTDIAKARRAIDMRRAIRDLDMEALEVNFRLVAIYKPVARDLRFVMTLSRAVYDLERISGEAVRLADMAQDLYESPPTKREQLIFDDMGRITGTALDLLDRSLTALAAEDVNGAVSVALDCDSLEMAFRGALRRLATFLMEDPRNIRWVIDATLAIKAMERIGDHSCSIARNLIYSITGKDVRHASVANLSAD